VNRKKLYSFVEIDDKTPIQKLSIGDQLRALLQRLTHNDANDLKAEDATTIQLLRLKANLLQFIKKSTEPIRKGEHKSVVVLLSGKFNPVLDEVLASPQITSFYHVTMTKPDVEYNIPYTIEVKLEVRTD
jgi:hypothetical protein